MAFSWEEKKITKAQRKIGAKRLLATAALLEIIPPEKFDMGRWIGYRDTDGIQKTVTDLNHCGTAACAWGHAMISFPQLQPVVRHGHHLFVLIEGVQHSLTEGACEFYHLTTKEAEALFWPAHVGSVTQAMEIRRLRKFAASMV